MKITKRPRRLRLNQALRNSLAEISVGANDLIAPFFVVDGKNQKQAIKSLANVYRLSTDNLLKDLERALKLGINSAVLFGVVDSEQKSALGKSSHDHNGPVATALRAAKAAFGSDINLITDVCLCGYTDHGHCGILKKTSQGYIIDNDSSLEHLAQMAVMHAEAGADIVSPSDMMDGRVGAIRESLDSQGFNNVGILSYAVKYASAFYGPFREAAGSSPNKSLEQEFSPPKDRKTYQMDYRNVRTAFREAKLDEEEGADMLMVKPALPYLDVLARLRPQTSLPLVAYNVSGEYAMFKAAAKIGSLDEPLAVHEALTAIKRAGADLIITYYALEALEKGWLD